MAAPSAAEGLRLSGQEWRELAPVQANRLVEPGESGRLVIRLWNDSSSSASGITGTLSIVEPATGVTASSPATSWPDLGPGASAADTGNLTIDVSPAVACGTRLRLALQLASSAGTESLFIDMRTGLAAPAAMPRVELPFGGELPHVAIRGDVAAVVASMDDFVSSWIELGRFDVATGARLGADVTLSGADRHRYPRVAAGPDRWCATWVNARFFEGCDAWVAVMDADGTVLSSQRVHLAQADRRGAFAPNVAADGTGGFGVVYRADRLGDEAQSAREIVFVHVDRDGAIDAGPVRIDIGMSAQPWTIPVIWTGHEFAVLAANGQESRLVRVLPDGTSTAGPFLPGTALGYSSPALAMTGHGLGIAAATELTWLGLLSLAPDGSARRTPTQIVAWPSAAYTADDRPSRSLAWDGAGFGVAVTAGVHLPPDGSSHFVDFAWLDADGKRHRPDVALTPVAPDQHVAVVGDAVFDGARDEFLVPVVDGQGWEGFLYNWFPAGTVKILRVARNSTCPAGEAPREVSATAATALRVRKEWGPSAPGDPGSLTTVVSFEDLGAEAAAYNLAWGRPTASRFAFPGFTPGFWEFPECGVVPQPSPFKLRADGPGRLAWWAVPATPVSPSGRRLEFIYVTASNQWGDGPRAQDASGAPVADVPGCFPAP